MLLTFASARDARAQEALDLVATTRRGRDAGPLVRVTEARVGAAAALRAGANLFVRENPTLSVWSGPRLLPTGAVIPDLTLALSWPFDLTGSRAQRSSWAEAAVRVAEADGEVARRAAALDARDAWLEAVLARDAAALWRAQVEIDASALRIAQVRRTNGAAGDDEVALARLGLATTRARLVAYEGDERAAGERLRGRLHESAPVRVSGELPLGEAPPLALLLASLARRPDVRRAEASAEAARRDGALQERLAVPLVRAGLGLGRENEYYARVGLDVGLPVFQRNQTSVAQARAQVLVALAEREYLLAQAESELRAAHAHFEGARLALATLDEALAFAADAERLALRAYELGQRSLAETLVLLREAARLRQSRHEAAASTARARLALDRASGELP